MNLDYHYVDPRLVALYDSDNPRGADTDFYVTLAAQLKAQIIFAATSRLMIFVARRM